MAKKFKDIIQFYPNAKKGKPEESEGTLDTQNGMPAVVVKEQKNDQMEITHKSGRKETAKVHMTGSDYHIVKNKHGQQFTVNKKGHVLHGHGNVNEESELDESMTDSWKNVQSMDKGSLTGGKEEAKKHLAYLNAVHAHHKKYGNDTKKVRDKIESINRSRIAEDVIAEGAYEKSEENKRSADAAKKQGDMFAHHLHMSDHHDNLAQWHAEKGRHSVSDMHAKKAEQHHEKAMSLKEETVEESAAYMAAVAAMPAAAYVGAKLGNKLADYQDKKRKEKAKADLATVKARRDAKKLNKEEIEIDESQAPVAPTIDRKYIKGTPEWKAHKEKTKPRVGHPTNKVKEETEMETQLDERNKENAIKRKMMDASRGARYKVAGNPVPEPGEKHSTARAHNKAIGRALRNEETEEAPMQFTQEELQLIEQFIELAERMNLSKATMGDVIKDFKKSDAPQFAGKSDEKRRQMAIAAKLQADREAKKEEKEVTSFSGFVEALKGNQHKIDKNKNGKIDSQDFKMLRKEETEQVEENAFDWKSKKSEPSSGRYDIKRENGRTIVTRKYNPDTGHSTGTDDEPNAPKRGRGRPAGSKNRGSAK